MTNGAFSKKIKCIMCGKNFNFKNNNGTRMYICQTRKNKGKSVCSSQTVDEDLLLELVRQHCELKNKNYSPNKVELFVKEVKVSNADIIVYYKDGEITKLIGDTIIF